MGAKIELAYLTDKDNLSILTAALGYLLYDCWSYNRYIPGEYTYWLDGPGPIYLFGDSKTVKETDLATETSESKMHQIISELANHYSPSIVLGTIWFGKVITAGLAIVELNNSWKEVTFWVDREDAFDSVDPAKQNEAAMRLFKIFSNLALSIEPYYGLAATEIMGVVDSPEDLHIDSDSENPADFYYFSHDAKKQLELSKLEQKCVVEVLENEGLLLYRRYGLLELG